MKTKKTLDQFVTEQYGAIGTDRRTDFEQGYETFKFGALIQQARLKKGYTQAQLADKIGSNKAYISRVENNTKDLRLSTLQRIIEGLGGQLNLSISI
jgi:HTH-type transcriptional regulator / antitoxin HipB